MKKVLVCVLVIFLILGGILLWKSGTFTKDDNPASVSSKTYPFDIKPYEKGLKIENVVIYSKDLDYRFGLQFPDTTEAKQNLSNWKNTVESLNEDVILQNEGIKLKLYPAGDGPINYYQVNKTKEHLLKEVISNISFEIVTIFFNNFDPPKIGIPKAKETAFKVLTDLRNKVVSGQYTMEQAGELIRSMKELEDVDTAYKVNAYSKYDNILPEQRSIDPEMLKTAWQLKKGEVSELMINKDDKAEYYYSFLKINDIKISEYKNLQDFLDKRKTGGSKLPL